MGTMGRCDSGQRLTLSHSLSCTESSYSVMMHGVVGRLSRLLYHILAAVLAKSQVAWIGYCICDQPAVWRCVSINTETHEEPFFVIGATTVIIAMMVVAGTDLLYGALGVPQECVIRSELHTPDCRVHVR